MLFRSDLLAKLCFGTRSGQVETAVEQVGQAGLRRLLFERETTRPYDPGGLCPDLAAELAQQGGLAAPRISDEANPLGTAQTREAPGLVQDVEIIFCAKSPYDPAIPFLERLIAAHAPAHARILVGDELGTANPKLNNIAKGWREIGRAHV